MLCKKTCLERRNQGLQDISMEENMVIRMTPATACQNNYMEISSGNRNTAHYVQENIQSAKLPRILVLHNVSHATQMLYSKLLQT